MSTTKSSGPLRAVRWGSTAGTTQIRPDVKPVLAGTAGAPLVYQKWRKALAATLAGTTNSRILIIGDSTSAGIQTASGGSYLRTTSTLLGKMLAAFVPVNCNSAFGNPERVGGATFTTYDPRWVTAGTAWATLGIFASAGGNAMSNSTTLETVSFTPTDPLTGAAYPFDSFDIYSATNTGYGTWTVNVDGGAALATVNDAGTRALRKTTVSCAAGTHTINIQRTGVGGQVYIIGIVPRLTTAKKVEILNIAAGSYTIGDLAGSAGDFTTGGVIDNIAAHLSIIDIGINDRRLAAYTSAFDTGLQTLITRCKATGDVILCLPSASSLTASAYTTQANQDAFDDAITRLAASNGCMLFSKRNLLGTYEVAQPLGWYSDTLHPSVDAYGAIAMDLAQYVLA